MQFSLEQRTASLSVGEFSEFALGPHESGGGAAGVWRAQLGQHWHNELCTRTEREFTVGGVLRPDVQFEVVIEGRLTHRGWTFLLAGRIDQLVGPTLREIKSVMRPLPAAEPELRAEHPAYFLQLAAYTVLRRTQGAAVTGAELVFVEASSGLAQVIALTPFDEALVYHQLDALVEFLNLQLRATERRRALQFQPPFPALRAGQENIQADLAAAFARSPTVLFEAPTGYGKTGCVLEYALGQLRAGRYARLIWLTGKSTGQLQVVRTLQQMTAGSALPLWQVRNKGEHCVNSVFHCVRDACSYLAGCEERWPSSGLARFYLDEKQPRDLDTLRRAGRDARICPYEITRAALAFNDVWIGDYNYVFAPDNRSLFFEQPGFAPGQTLLVIDEAHNLPSRVADAYSHTVHEEDTRALLVELDHQGAPAALVLAVYEWARVLGSIGATDSLDPVLEAELHDVLERLAELVTTLPLDHAALGPHHSETLWQFAKLNDFLSNAALRKLLWSPRAGELNFTCVDATEAIGATLRTFGGALLMSATLLPFENSAAACGLLAPATLRAPAPWRDHAYDVAVDARVDTTFRQRAGYYGTTAETIEALHRTSASQLSTLNPQPTATPCVAVFFPSYAYAEAVLRTLENSGSVLRVALQPKLPDLAAQTAWVEENLALADALLLVLGSSFAEGIDLLGGRVSHAMVVGPALPEVNALQKARLDALSELGRDAAFRRVYQIPGLQKVNQALGRLVRAPGQKAKVLLHCRRFADVSYAALLAPEYQQYREVASEADLRDWLAGSG
ncbi:MAG: helicase [Opitutae bacterium]|nr:helicase [Opitutae bacterium]